MKQAPSRTVRDSGALQNKNSRIDTGGVEWNVNFSTPAPLECKAESHGAAKKAASATIIEMALSGRMRRDRMWFSSR